MSFKLIDFGVNYAHARFKNGKVDKILEVATLKGVENVVSISNSISECKENFKLAGRIPNLYFTAGCHPHNAKIFNTGDLDLIRSMLEHPKCIAVGEFGLDFNRNFSPREDQMNAFKLQLELAKNVNKKMYLHCRDAYSDFITAIKEYGYFNGLVHCFTGSLEEALELTGLGFKLGITGWLLDKRRNENLQAAVSDSRITLDMLIVETDAPFMPLKKKKESVPEDTFYVVEEIARLKGIPVEECGHKLYEVSSQFLLS